MENSLKIYTSSAGSGKTFTLVKEYLTIVLHHPEEYRHILAITFTNKAANEMKSRVIEALISLESGAPSDLRSKLEEEIPATPITENAGRVLKSILHDYPSFAISTIDSFFQKLLRSLAREIHLPLRAEVKLEEDDAVWEVTERLLQHSGTDKELAGWLEQLIFKKLDEDKGWNIQSEIAWIGKELLKERGASETVLDRKKIHALFNTMSARKKEFEDTIHKLGQAALERIQRAGYDETHFAYGTSGVYGYLKKIAVTSEAKEFQVSARARQALIAPEEWLKKGDRKDTALVGFIADELQNLLQSVAELVDKRFRTYVSDVQVLKTLFLFGIVNDLTYIFRQYRHEHNQILISDTAKLLQEIITGDDTPFIFEKTGNKYKYLLIDEFQDTSEVQWKNLLPLVINSLGSGFMAMVVGDAKQSIYRWRGGDMNLLLKGIQEDLHFFGDLIKPEALNQNFRSKKEIVEFNNGIFTTVLQLIRNMDGIGDLSIMELAYGKNVSQLTAPKNTTGGYVEVRFLSKDTTGKEASAEEKSAAAWNTKALHQTLETINELVDRGYRYRDITILVRTKSEGNSVAQHLFQHNIRKVISPDSLLINSSTTVRFMINALRTLIDPTNTIARSQVLYYYSTFIHPTGQLPSALFQQYKKRNARQDAKPALFEADAFLENTFNRILPEEFTGALAALAKLPVYEVCEQLISIFNLNKTPDAFLQRFQDLVLEFNAKHHASIRSFINYWDENQKVREKSVVIPENENAIRIMTIHASKGLQFPVVIMPFVDWELLPRANSLVWVQSDEKEFRELGRIGVNTSAILSHSVFKEDYEREIVSSIIDSINMMYVAFTRPEEELYVFAPVDNGKELNFVNKLLWRTMAILNHTANQDMHFIFGTKNTCYQPKKDATVSEPLSSYPVNRWQDKIRVSTRVRKLGDLMKEKSTPKTRYGVLVHDILASIGTIDDLDLALDKIKFEGILNETEKQELSGLVAGVVNHPEIRRFFDTGYHIMREKEILLPGAKVIRPDRVLIKDQEVILIDFKTGQANEGHHEQLRHYGEALKAMGYSGITKYLVYLKDQPEVVEVKEDSEEGKQVA